MFFIDKFIEIIKEYTDEFSTPGLIHLGVDALLTLIIIFIIYRLLRIRFHKKRAIIIALVFFLVYGTVFVFQLVVSFQILNWLLFWSFGVIIIVFSQEIKHFIESTFRSTRNENLFATVEEKHQVVETLVRASVYLSKRRIGALVSIEREDSLNALIDKAIFIKGVLSEELLTTLFFVGTATHDGAVIIRKNRIMCAGAYLPTTDKYDVPKSLGTRHRAAIGLSERYDAVTIVISEETGNISLTADGVIEVGITEDQLREMLERYFIVK
ncbi:MAG: diadenylate cyclase [Bacilli bacterium]|nr:diadenylate cyclase [Bacilli bacterium]